jgi:preprotein translocase subunit SecY
MAGVIPAIFASSLLLAPSSLAQWFGQTNGMEWLQEVSLVLSPGQPLYILMFAGGIVFFSFFYTAIVFDPKDVAETCSGRVRTCRVSGRGSTRRSTSTT